MHPHRRRVHRRSVLGSIGIGAAVGLAGCLGEDDGEPDDDGEPEDDTDEPELATPVDFPPADDEEGGCAVCAMHAVDYPDWNAQLVHADGHREFFCSTGCLVTYYFAPEKFTGGDPDAEITGVWASSFESGELIDATEATFVYEQDRDRHDYPMPRGSPLAFAERDDAAAYVAEYEELTEDEHLITLEDVDREIAEFYREPRLEDEREE